MSENINGVGIFEGGEYVKTIGDIPCAGCVYALRCGVSRLVACLEQAPIVGHWIESQPAQDIYPTVSGWYCIRRPNCPDIYSHLSEHEIERIKGMPDDGTRYRIPVNPFEVPK
jgi:hypothetical protein